MVDFTSQISHAQRRLFIKNLLSASETGSVCRWPGIHGMIVAAHDQKMAIRLEGLIDDAQKELLLPVAEIGRHCVQKGFEPTRTKFAKYLRIFMNSNARSKISIDDAKELFRDKFDQIIKSKPRIIAILALPTRPKKG